MKRSVKNIINIIIIVALIAANGASVYFAKQQVQSSSSIQQSSQGDSSQDQQMQQPPDMPSDSNQQSDEQSNQQSGQQPEMPNGDSQGTMGGDGETPPDKPDGDDNNAQGNNDLSQQDSAQAPSSNDMQQGNSNSSISIIYYIIFGAENLALALAIMYFIMSKANKLNGSQTFKNSDKIVIYILASVIIVASLTTADGVTLNKLTQGGGNSSSMSQMQTDGDSSSPDATGATVVQDTQSLDGEFSSTTADESAVLVEDSGALTLTNASITKTGDSSNTENSEFYGINAGLLVTEGATATIKSANISTDATGSNAVFATGTDAKIYISDSTITTSGSSSARGLDATYGGYIEADNVKITTQGGSCASLATDRGEGTVIAKNSTLNTNGSGSPVIYSTGDISVTNCEGTAKGAQMVVVEGKNSATVENSTLVCSGAGNRNDVDNAGIMIYQSMSGDADEGTGNFTAKKSSLTIDSDSDYYKSAPMFFITNTDAVIDLESTTLNFGSGVLLSAKGTSEWGNDGSNGGNITFTATSQKLDGDIQLDKISTLDLTLNSSSYSGTINADNTAKSVAITLDANSSITLTGDSYVTSLENADSSNSNINLNGYTLYVNGTALK